MNDETVRSITDSTKHALFTNISFAQMESTNLRLDCKALLLEEGALGLVGKQNRIRGFGPDPGWPIFTYWLSTDKQMKYSLKKCQDNSVQFIGTRKNAKPKPLFRGATLTFENGPSFFLQIEDPKHDFDIFENTGDIEEVWRQLEVRVARYWQAPYMPTNVVYGPPTDVIERDNARLRTGIKDWGRK